METELSKFEQEQDAGRAGAARGRPEGFADEIAAGRVDKMRARLEEEQQAGQRAAERTGG